MVGGRSKRCHCIMFSTRQWSQCGYSQKNTWWSCWIMEIFSLHWDQWNGIIALTKTITTTTQNNNIYSYIHQCSHFYNSLNKLSYVNGLINLFKYSDYVQQPRKRMSTFMWEKIYMQAGIGNSIMNDGLYWLDATSLN